MADVEAFSQSEATIEYLHLAPEICLYFTYNLYLFWIKFAHRFSCSFKHHDCDTTFLSLPPANSRSECYHIAVRPTTHFGSKISTLTFHNPLSVVYLARNTRRHLQPHLRHDMPKNMNQTLLKYMYVKVMIEKLRSALEVLALIAERVRLPSA